MSSHRVQQDGGGHAEGSMDGGGRRGMVAIRSMEIRIEIE